ncbi:hypothetical protein Sjap_009433 [Stephania japonica]|uniref:WAT1-related protein n=1 Tax=Stephania japonica TaxID=461633 RepID=A0AAP0JRY7_9MAGN
MVLSESKEFSDHSDDRATTKGGAAAKVGALVSMVAVQAITAGYFALTNVIVVNGMSSTVVLVYQYILATVFMGFLAVIFERKNRPPLTLKIFLSIFLLAFVGITLAQNLMAGCLYFISSTVDTAVINMVPVFTYILSVITREEKLEINTLWGKGKLIGTLISVGGALTLMSWRGSSLLSSSSMGHWILGLAMVVLGVLAFSSWILMLRPMVNMYPAEFSLTALMFLCATFQTAILAAILSHNNASDWTLKWNLELILIVFGGVLNSGIANLLYTWSASVKGPIFVATFSPLTYVFTTILDVAFLGSSLYLGSVIGSIVIVVGLYMYLWSKSKEDEKASAIEDQQTSISSPLLV